MTTYAASYKELWVYRKARSVAALIFEVSKRFPREEMFALTDQIRRSSRAIGAQITEAWGKRRYEKHFVSKLTDADGEQYETRHWVDIAWDCGYLTQDEAERLEGLLSEIGRLLNGVIEKSDSFCAGADAVVREPPSSYFAPAP